jgi:hypothetical protein
MSSNWIRIGIVLAAVGCAKKPNVASKELGELGLFLFAHFEDADPAEMAAGLLDLKGQVKAQDLSLDPKDLAVSMPILEGDNLGSLSIPDGADASEQIPIALAGESIHPLDDQLITVFEPNQICIESESTTWAQREFLTDTGCFEDGSCNVLEVQQEVRKENVLAKVWFDQYKNYRWFDLEDEEGNLSRALVGRSWIDRVFEADGGGNSWDQLFHIDVFIEDGDKTARWFSLWSSIDVGGIGDDLYGQLVIDGIAEALLFGDEFISTGGPVTCENDRSLPKPERE